MTAAFDSNDREGMMRVNCVLWVLLLVAAQPLAAAEYSLPDRVSVMPVAFVPKGEQPPTDEQRKLFIEHIQWSQRRYEELLGGDTFRIAKLGVEVVTGQRPLEFYRNSRERGAPDLVSELLNHFAVSRFQCPYVFCIMFMNSKDRFPEGGGRTINGGMNTGGGMLHISSGELTRNEHYQCTLQHELGHAFGLPHVDVYGYDMQKNDSLMSYNPKHHNKGMQPSATPSLLIPEDRRALALNDRVFSKTTFDSLKHVPAAYSLAKRIVPLGPMELPGHPDFYPRVTTTAGEDVGSKVINIVREEIKPSVGPGITYDNTTMWHSKPLAGGSADLQITFPMRVRVSGLSIHSQHSGIDHQATAMRLEARDDGKRLIAAEQTLSAADELVRFEAIESKQWSLTLRAGNSRILVIRGLRFFDGDEEILPHMVPFAGERKSNDKPKDKSNNQFAYQAAAKKRPPPTAAQQETAKKAVKEQFKAEYLKAKKPEQKGALARTLFENADKARDDAATFALLNEAATNAAQAGQLDLALIAIKALDDRFFVDVLPLKITALAAAPPAKTADEATLLLAKYKDLAEEAVRAEDYGTAVKALQTAATELVKPNFKPLKDDALATGKRMAIIRDAFEAARPSRDLLKSSPDDPAANLAWGKFVCFFKQDLARGLPMLAKANDKIWAPIAQRELKPDKLSSDFLQLGDDWFEVGEREKDPIRPIARDRADQMWQQAIAIVPDIGKAETEQKVDQRFVKLFGSSFVATNGNAAGATIPGTDRFSPGDYFTIEFWVSTRTPRGTLLSKCHNVGDSSIIAHVDGGAPNLSIKKGGGEGGSGAGAPINEGLWHHIAIVKKHGEISMYVDGRLGSRATEAAALASSSPWKFGCSRDRPACAARFGGIRISNTTRYEENFTPKKSFAKDSKTLFPP